MSRRFFANPGFLELLTKHHKHLLAVLKENPFP
jgi:hypothetical protein